MNDDALIIKRTLAADFHFSDTDLTNDQVWELNAAGDPPAAAMRTSYGLRSRGIRVYPRFTTRGQTLTDPANFAAPLRILERHGNYMQLECNPFPYLNVQLEYWVPSSQALCSRFKLTNLADSPLNFSVEWTVILNPLDPGETMAPIQMGVNTVLLGKSDDLYPVFFVTGGPQAILSAHPALEVRMALGSGASRRLSWALATLDSPESSFAIARQMTSLPWEAETVRAGMVERNVLVGISSADDANGNLMHEAQIKARQCLVQSPPPGKRLTFLTRRQPDARTFKPVSRREELISYSQINAYDAWALSRILLPGDPQPFKEIVSSFIDFQQENGAIPWAVSKNGSTSSALTPPLLAGIVCDVYPYLEENDWLTQAYDPLLRAFKAWFPQDDRQLPVWDNPLQSGLPDDILYSTGNGEGFRTSPEYVHSPALLAFLFRECASLTKIARWLDTHEEEEWLTRISERLSAAIAACWDAGRATFTYRDAASGLCHAAETVHSFSRNSEFKLKRNFKVPRRMTLFVPDQAGSNGRITVMLKGSMGEEDRTETLEIRSRFTGLGGTRGFSSQLFSRLESVEVSGLRPKGSLILGLAGNDSEDISLLLPIWADAVTDEQRDALIEKTILPRYLTDAGLVTYPIDRAPPQDNTISPFWNTLIAEGLLAAGRRKAAAGVLSNLSKTQMEQWKNTGYVNTLFKAEGRHGVGEMDTLMGLPSVLPLLRVMGVEKLTENEIILSGLNEHLHPYTVKYKGMTLVMQPDLTSIQTLYGESSEIKENIPCKIVFAEKGG